MAIRVVFAEFGEAGLKSISRRIGLEFPENQIRMRLRYSLARDASDLGLEPIDVWPDREFYVGRIYAGLHVRILVELSEDRATVWSISETAR